MAYHAVQLDPVMSRGAVGGPRFSTVIIRVAAGTEQRQGFWSRPLMQWDIGFAGKSRSEMETLKAFFIARSGRLHTFRFKDWQDYTAVSQPLVLVTTGTYQLYKSYTSGSITVYRKITKPISAITFGGGGSGTVDYSTGLVTSGTAGTWSGEFDCHARFDSDEMDMQLLDVENRAWPRVRVLEIME